MKSRNERTLLTEPLLLADRPGEPLPAPSDWSFELIDQYHRIIRQTAPTRTSSRSSPPSR